MLVHVLAELTDQLTRHLAVRDQGAVLLVCALKYVGGETRLLRIGLVQPSASAPQLMELVDLHLETVTLADEVAHGLLTMDEAEATANFQWRAALRVHALKKRMERYADHIVTLCTLAAELAFKKRQHRVHGDEDDTVAEIDRLRDEIRAVRESLK